MGNLIWIDIGMIVTYALLGLALLGALLAAVRGLIANPKGAKVALFGFIGVAVVISIAFGLSSGADISEVLLEKTNTSHWWVRPVGAGMFSFYLLLGCTITMLIATEVMRPFKK